MSELNSMNQEEEVVEEVDEEEDSQQADEEDSQPVSKKKVKFDSKFSKTFHHQIRIFIDAIYKVYIKKFKKTKMMNQIDKDFFWIITTYFINKRAGICMNMTDIKSQYFRKHTSQKKNRIKKIDHNKRLVRKIMK